MKASTIPWLVSGSSIVWKILHNEFSFASNPYKQPIICVDQYFSGTKAIAIGNQT